MDTTPPPTITQALDSLTKRNESLEKIMIYFMVFLGIFGALLIVSAAFSSEAAARVVGLTGGSTFGALIIFPYSKIQDLRKQNIIIGMLAAIIDRFQDKMGTDTFSNLIKVLAEYALRK